MTTHACGLACNPVVVAVSSAGTLALVTALVCAVRPRRVSNPAPQTARSLAAPGRDRAGTPTAQPRDDAKPFAGGAYTLSGGQDSTPAQPPADAH